MKRHTQHASTPTNETSTPALRRQGGALRVQGGAKVYLGSCASNPRQYETNPANTIAGDTPVALTRAHTHAHMHAYIADPVSMTGVLDSPRCLAALASIFVHGRHDGVNRHGEGSNRDVRPVGPANTW